MSATSGGRRRSTSKRRAAPEDDHGGQWKIAYADFVTAMMAFFLVMWLISSATETQRAVIAKYFSTTSIFDLPKGNGVLDGGKSVMSGTEAKTEKLKPSGGGGSATTSEHQTRTETGQESADDAAASNMTNKEKLERQRFEAMKAELERMVQQGELHDLASNLMIDLTPEGLRIQIFDRDGEPMFAAGDATPTPRLARILGVISEVLQTVRNGVIIAGHTDAQPLQRGGYSNWELSAERANSARRQLEADGLAPDRMVRVEGLAAIDPLLPQTPLDPRNRRVAVTVLRSDVEAQLRQPGGLSPGPSP
jgi:chemotaxis protein MotB